MADETAPSTALTPEEARKQYLSSYRPIAALLREEGMGHTADDLVATAKHLEQSPSLAGTGPLENRANRSLAEASSLDSLKSSMDLQRLKDSVRVLVDPEPQVQAQQVQEKQAAEILKNPELAQQQTAAQQQAQAKKKAPDNGVGLLDVVDKGGVVSSFVSNFSAHFDSAKAKPSEEAKAVPKQAPAEAEQKPTAGEQKLAPEANGPGEKVSQSAITPGAAFSKADVPFELLGKLGVSAELLERNGQLEKLLRGEKTDLIPAFGVPNAQGEVVPFAAKLVLHRDEDGGASLKFDLPKKELTIPEQLMGTKITPDMKKELETTGRLAGIHEFTDSKGQPFKAFVGVDRAMNKLTMLRQDSLKLPEEIRGVKLTNEQRELVAEGKPVKLAGLSNGSDKPLFTATIQVDAGRKGIAINPDRADLRMSPSTKQDAKVVQGKDVKQEVKQPVKKAPKIGR